MLLSKTDKLLTRGATRTKSWRLMLAGVFVAGAFGLIALRVAWGTPPTPGLFTSTPIVGPVVFEPINTKSETDDHIDIKTRDLCDVYVTQITIKPGGNGGWHSHPGPSIISVKSGTATFYDDCVDFAPQQFTAGTGFVEDAGCVHLLANEGNVDLEVIVMQIVPFAAPRRIDEPAPAL